MPFLSESPLKAPILASLSSDTPRPARARARGAADPIDDLVIPPADGKVLRPGDAEFNGLLPFNLRTTVRPRVIAQCKTARGVSLAIQWARQHGVALCGHGDGHSYEGFSSCSGLMIDVRKMNAVVIDTPAQTARIGAGCLLGDVAERLWVQRFALPAGTCKPVGIAGLTMGGGHGVSSRKFGLTSDHLLSARLVDATGAELTASPTANPDLFWALRGGGGGNFGIVTEFTFKVRPVNRVIAFLADQLPDRDAERMAEVCPIGARRARLCPRDEWERGRHYQHSLLWPVSSSASLADAHSRQAPDAPRAAPGHRNSHAYDTAVHLH